MPPKQPNKPAFEEVDSNAQSASKTRSIRKSSNDKVDKCLEQTPSNEIARDCEQDDPSEGELKNKKSRRVQYYIYVNYPI